MGETRTALVTGGAKGIGLAVSVALAGRGHRVIALGRDRAALDALPAGIEGWPCDVTDEQAVTAAIAERGSVDILVNNAGMSASNPLAKVTLGEWEEHLRVNATGPFLCIRAVLPAMLERGWGRIVTVASTASCVGGRYIAAYAASKHAVLGLMRSAAAEAAGRGVTVNCVSPSFVRTEMTNRSVATIAARTGRPEHEAVAALEAASPLGRLVEPDEVAAAVAYLASDDAAAVNGQSLILDGGAIQQ